MAEYHIRGTPAAPPVPATIGRYTRDAAGNYTLIPETLASVQNIRACYQQILNSTPPVAPEDTLVYDHASMRAAGIDRVDVSALEETIRTHRKMDAAANSTGTGLLDTFKRGRAKMSNFLVDGPNVVSDYLKNL